MSGVGAITAAGAITPQIAALRAAPYAMRYLPQAGQVGPPIYTGTAARNLAARAPIQPTCIGCA